MSHIAIEVPTKIVGENLNAAVSFSNRLAEGESLSGVPTVTEDVTSDLTISDEAISTTVLNISGIDVPIGEAVQFKVIGGVAGSLYAVHVHVDTDSTPAQLLFGKITFNVEAD